METYHQVFILVVVVVVVVVDIWLSNATQIFSVLPNNPTNVSCPSQPCATLDQYLLDNGTLPVVSNVEYHFLPGEHAVPTNIQIKNAHNFTLVGDISADPLVVFVGSSTFSVHNSSKVIIANMLLKKTNDQRFHTTNLVLLTCISCRVENFTFLGYGLQLHNLLGNSLLSNIKINMTTSCNATAQVYYAPYGIQLVFDDKLQVNDTAKTEIKVLDIRGKVGIGMYIILNQTKYSVTVLVYGTNFNDIDKRVMKVHSTKKAMQNTFVFDTCSFNSNHFKYTDGYMSMVLIELSRYNQTITFRNCYFGENENAWKALIFVLLVFDQSNTTCVNLTTVTLENSNFFKNNSPLLYFSGKQILNCTNVLNIGPVHIHNNSAHEHSIAMFNMTVNLTGPVTISNNTAWNTAIMLFDSCDVLFNKEVTLKFNDCFKLIKVQSRESYIKVMEFANITLIDNRYYGKLLAFETDGYNSPYKYCYFQYIPRNNIISKYVSPTHYSINIVRNYHKLYYKMAGNEECELHRLVSYCKWIPTSAFNGINSVDINQQIIKVDGKELHRHAAVCHCKHNETSCNDDVLGSVYPGQVLQVELCAPIKNSYRYLILHAETHNAFLPENSTCKIAQQSELLQALLATRNYLDLRY